MSKILISGLMNIETTLKVSEFPIEYTPIDYQFFGIESTVSGVGYNIAKSLKTLGDTPVLLSIIGNDMYKNTIEYELKEQGINTEYVLPIIDHTPQSGILYDKMGKRKIILDLKDVQETKYPMENFRKAKEEADIAIICNTNFSRPFLKEMKIAGKIIATDVHVLNNLNDEYNKDFLEYSDILFLSNELILGKEKEFIIELSKQYNQKIIVIGMGAQGALIYVREEENIRMFPAIKTRDIISTIGAGDALFSSFIHFYLNGKDPYLALENATIYASYKIGEKGAASGFVGEEKLIQIKESLKLF